MTAVAIVGLWHQGVVAAACHADWGHDVIAADYNRATVAMLSEGKAPLFEPGLDELLSRGLAAHRLQFSETPADAVTGRRFVILAFDTPVDADDRSDFAEFWRTVEEITPNLCDYVVIHVTAQVPVGTCDEVRKRISKVRPTLMFGISYSPENLRLGVAIERFRRPPLPVIGSDDEWVLRALEALYSSCEVQWHRCGIRTAEMSKHALNGFLATSVCFANEIGNLCDEVGADGYRLAELLRLEPRVGAKAMLFPGLGFSGGTLARDIQTLRALGDRVGVETPLLDGTWQSNQQQNRCVVRRLKAVFGGSLKGRRIAVLGLTYKVGTSTLRRSAAVEISRDLAAAGASVSATDPKADRGELRGYSSFVFHETVLEAVRHSDAVVLMTPWTEFRDIDFSAVKAAMRGEVVFDTANFWNPDVVAAAGLRYLNIGRGRHTRN
jgi:UDPglucose 6-dehydrogenase